MKILADRDNPMFLSIWLIRLFAIVSVLVLIGVIILFAKELLLSEPIENIVHLLTILGLAALSYKYLNSNVVYIDERGILVKGVFSKHYYSIEEFQRIGYYFSYFGWLYIELNNGDKFHIVVQEMHAQSYRGFANDEYLLNHLNKQIHSQIRQEN